MYKTQMSYGNIDLREKLRTEPNVAELRCAYALSILKDIIDNYNGHTYYGKPSLPLTPLELPIIKHKKASEKQNTKLPLNILIEQNSPIFPKNFDFQPWFFNDLTNTVVQNQKASGGRIYYYNFEKNFASSRYSYEAYQKYLNEAKDELQISLALGLSNRFVSAKARAFLAKSQLTIIVHEDLDIFKRVMDKNENIDLSKLPLIVEVKEIIMALIRDLKGYLREFPYDLEALYLLRAAFKANNNQVELARAIQAYSQAESLIKAKLIPGSLSTNPVDIKIASQTSNVRRTQKNTGLDFENRVKKLLESMGFTATTTKATSDGGIDIVAFNQSPMLRGKYIIQCKDWKNPVGEPVLRDLYGLVLAEGANKGILMTTGDFTNAAIKFSEGKPLELINGEELNKLTIDQARKSR
ncbi:MAG: restriction endonuclease [Anaerolineaceae bacterium]